DAVRTRRHHLQRRRALPELDRHAVGRGHLLRGPGLRRRGRGQQPSRSRGRDHVSTRRGAAPVKGIRRLERWFVGVLMGIVAFILEKIVLRSVKKKHPVEEGTAST